MKITGFAIIFYLELHSIPRRLKYNLYYKYAHRIKQQPHLQLINYLVIITRLMIGLLDTWGQILESYLKTFFYVLCSLSLIFGLQFHDIYFYQITFLVVYIGKRFLSLSLCNISMIADIYIWGAILLKTDVTNWKLKYPLHTSTISSYKYINVWCLTVPVCL